MTDSLALLAQLRQLVAPPARAYGDGPEEWLARGLPRAQVHEIYAEEAGDAAVAAGFAAVLTLAGGTAPLLWLRDEAAERQAGRLHATGLRELGLDPAQLVMAVVADEGSLLRAAADAARCAGLGAVLVEAWGRAPGLDLTATRRLQLAAEASGVLVLLLRIDARPGPSAAATRWGVTACLSTPLDADAPGRPAFLLELQRRRGGPAGQRWRVEWDRDEKSFAVEALSGAGIPLVAGGPAARDAPASVRAGR